MGICPAQKHDVIICKYDGEAAGTNADFVLKSQQEHSFLLWASSEGSAMEAIAINSSLSISFKCYTVRILITASMYSSL